MHRSCRLPWLLRTSSHLLCLLLRLVNPQAVRCYARSNLPAAVSVDKTQERLDELADDESTEKMLQLSQKEYLDKIEGLHTELLQAWNQNQRVKALKIVIQCSKLLADTSVIKFYPSKVLPAAPLAVL